MRFATVPAALLLLTACTGDGGPARAVLSPPKSASRDVSGLQMPVDPVNLSASPVQVSISSGILNFATKTYLFTATASGAPSGNYNYDWMVQTCDMNDYCHDWYLWDTTQSPTNTFTWTVPPGSAYGRVQVYVRENGVPNYYTGRSGASFVRGPDWGQFPAGGSVGGTCYANSYPFVEWTDSAGKQLFRNYSRNVCTGEKKYAP